MSSTLSLSIPVDVNLKLFELELWSDKCRGGCDPCVIRDTNEKTAMIAKDNTATNDSNDILCVVEAVVDKISMVSCFYSSLIFDRKDMEVRMSWRSRQIALKQDERDFCHSWSLENHAFFQSTTEKRRAESYLPPTISAPNRLCTNKWSSKPSLSNQTSTSNSAQSICSPLRTISAIERMQIDFDIIPK